MSDDKTKKRADRKRISLTESWEVLYWTKALKVSRERLETAVKEAGHGADAVRKWLARNPGTPPAG